MIDTGCKPRNSSRSRMTTRNITLSSLAKFKYIVEFRQIPRMSELHVFQDKRTNERVTRGMKMHAMSHLRRGHLALGWKPSVTLLSCMRG